MGAPKNAVTRCSLTVRRNSSGWYSRCRTTVPPTNIMDRNQLFSGEACQIGIEIRKRSVRRSPIVAVVYAATEWMPRWECRQPLGSATVPEV